jgi:hypothetical protein
MTEEAMRKVWAGPRLDCWLFYASALFAAMVRNPRYSGLARLSVANYIDAQPFALTVTIVALVSVIVTIRRG